MSGVLIIDDDPLFCQSLVSMTERMGYSTDFTHTASTGLQTARQGHYSVILLDVGLPDCSGLDILGELKEVPSKPEVIIITGIGDTSGAELAIRNGAWDYIVKGFNYADLRLPLARAHQYHNEKRISAPSRVINRDGILGTSQAIVNCLDIISVAAQQNASVLITGETGTGKELFARAIHNNSHRNQQKFVVLDCASLPETLLESMLFGYTKGAFTGADRDHAGLIKHADGGTLFLDEIGELPLNFQKAFLRVLQEKRFRPVGSAVETTSNFRLVAATNRNLDQMVKEGSFRKDLLFRLRTITLELPPLRERKKDIKDIVIHYLSQASEQFGMAMKGFSTDFLEALHNYDWPGNVRELLHTMESAVTLAQDEPTLFPTHLPMQMRISMLKANIVEQQKTPSPNPEEEHIITAFTSFTETRRNVLEKMERSYLVELIKRSSGDLKTALKISGLKQTRLYDLMKKHNLSLR